MKALFPEKEKDNILAMTGAFPVISQKVAEAIEAVVNIDVTIMNGDMIRIAGTGQYKDRVGNEIEKSTAFGYCLKSGETIVVENSRQDYVCKLCEVIESCTEKAEVCVPIIRGETPIGVIGIIAFNDEQKNKIIKNKHKYINFIQRMAQLLEAKFHETLISQENRLLSLRLNNILNAMNDALIVFDKEGGILYKNYSAIRLLSELGIYQESDFLSSLWDALKLSSSNKRVEENKEIHVKYNDQNYTLISSVYRMDPIHNEFIVKLQDFTRFERNIIKYNQKNEVSIDFNSILTISPNMIDVRETACIAAEVDSNVLIYGESGTGKELFARAIHNKSKRRDNAFIAINCGAIPDELLESELFGHEKGAFTGAINTKIGKFEVADGGTIFLDEISEMPFALQVKLLRVIQEKEICRIGSNETNKIDIRIIASTNADLLSRMRSGLFREDLYYRLNIIPLHIPPLRERKNDIMFLTEHYIKLYNKRFNKNIIRLTKNAKDIFISYDWPGNVRELQNVLEYAVNFETGEEIGEEIIKRRINNGSGKQSTLRTFDFENFDYAEATLPCIMDKVEKELILKKIKEYSKLKHKDIVKSICSDYQISRTTLYRKLNRYGIKITLEDDR